VPAHGPRVPLGSPTTRRYALDRLLGAGLPNIPKLAERGFASHRWTIAVFVCAPRSLSKELREKVSRHVSDRDVYWHAEELLSE